MEYCELLDQALDQSDPIMRLAYVSTFSTTILTTLEKNNTKPFNPLLGETFEYVAPNYKFLAEQVSHHPPVTAFNCIGNKGFRVWGQNRPKTKFTGKSIQFIQMYKIYVELEKYGELYEIT